MFSMMNDLPAQLGPFCSGLDLGILFFSPELKIM